MNYSEELIEFRRSLYRPTPDETVTAWCERNLSIPAKLTEAPGPFSTANRPYMREPLECFKDPQVSEMVLCWGAQVAKTTILIMGAIWCVVNNPQPAMWIFPNDRLAGEFSDERWRVMIECNPVVANERELPLAKKWKKLSQQFKRGQMNLSGSNSATNLSSRSAAVMIVDEVELLKDANAKETDALLLAEDRQKGRNKTKLLLTSKPNNADGRIWPRFLRGDQRRFYIPCPHCGQKIKLLWKQVKWDEARLPDGKGWDKRAVQASARYECQLCNGKITDSQKIQALRKGEWIAENPDAMPGIRSYHLSSLYSPDRKCTWGEMAVKWLDSMESTDARRGFINSYLAEPWENQRGSVTRTERIARLEGSDDWTKLMTVDCQKNGFWFVVRAWKDGNSEGVDAGFVNSWEEIEAKQKEWEINDCGVMVDSGWGARDMPQVYRVCASHGVCREQEEGLPIAVGWMPAKGLPGRKRWKDEETGVPVPYRYQRIDPWDGTANARQVLTDLFEFSGDFFKDRLQDLRERKGGTNWTVRPEVATEEFWRHLDAEELVHVVDRKTGRGTHAWRQRSSTWPNHMLDCEVMQLALAASLGFLPTEVMALSE